MTSTQEKILNNFKHYKTPVDGILNPRSIDVRSWDRRSQDEFNDHLENLIEQEYLGTKNSWLTLKQKGYDYLYRDYKVQDTKDLIMQVFAEHELGVNQVLMKRVFNNFVQKLERFHFDNFNKAMDSLISDELIEPQDDRFLKLTQKGYDYIY